MMRDRRGWITGRFTAVGQPGEGHGMRFRDDGTCLDGNDVRETGAARALLETTNR